MGLLLVGVLHGVRLVGLRWRGGLRLGGHCVCVVRCGVVGSDVESSKARGSTQTTCLASAVDAEGSEVQCRCAADDLIWRQACPEEQSMCRANSRCLLGRLGAFTSDSE